MKATVTMSTTTSRVPFSAIRRKIRKMRVHL